ncbi:MAG TPA: hypothetical protein VIK81_02145 [Patescibacteria group bacterium]
MIETPKDTLSQENSLSGEGKTLKEVLNAQYPNLVLEIKLPLISIFDKYDKLIESGAYCQPKSLEEINSILLKSNVKKVMEKYLLAEERLDYLLKDDENWEKKVDETLIRMGISGEIFDENFGVSIDKILSQNVPNFDGSEKPIVPLIDLRETLMLYSGIKIGERIFNFKQGYADNFLKLLNLGVARISSLRVNGQPSKTFDFILYEGDLPTDPKARRGMKLELDKTFFACTIIGDRQVKYIHKVDSRCTEFLPIDRTIEEF